jgi:hypothetical protein
MPSDKGNYFLALDLAVKCLRVVVVNDTLDVVESDKVEFEELSHYGCVLCFSIPTLPLTSSVASRTIKGSHVLGDESTSPTTMFVEALDILLEVSGQPCAVSILA